MNENSKARARGQGAQRIYLEKSKPVTIIYSEHPHDFWKIVLENGDVIVTDCEEIVETIRVTMQVEKEIATLTG